MSGLMLLPFPEGYCRMPVLNPGPQALLSSPLPLSGYCRKPFVARVFTMRFYGGPEMFFFSGLLCAPPRSMLINGKRWLYQSGRYYPADGVVFPSPHGRR
ncbi:hypothetical protein RX799_24660 [Klebsiella oxytoca]|uniref:hypothetical protein n=1 Tax=Klebsiella oxytoca TaxID=571 RepID=UPI00385109D4